MSRVVLVAVLALAGCGGATATTDPESCPRLAPYAAELERAGCAIPYDIRDAMAAGDAAACLSLAAKFDACAADRLCAEDMEVATIERCGGPGPQWTPEVP